MILRVPGAAALSPFRLHNLRARLKAVLGSVDQIAAHFVYLAETERELSPEETKSFEQILGVSNKPSRVAPEGEHFLAVPRPGTISPWSSKASEIVKRCGLIPVLRVERGIEYTIRCSEPLSLRQRDQLKPLLHDRMTQAVLGRGQEQLLFGHSEPAPLDYLPFLEEGRWALVKANSQLGLALSDQELDYLERSYAALKRNPTDVELMMFAQANSEHCRHKIFNASWRIDGEDRDQTLFGMIRHTTRSHPGGVISAYKDNAAVIQGPVAKLFQPDPASGEYGYREEPAHILMKVETHNHPTAISPHAGAATGSGGEIRDEGATGRGSRTKAGLTGFSVSHLQLPGFTQPWEASCGKPERIASPLQIMLEGPIGGAAFNNEFGRPNLAGYFRTFEQPDPSGKGYRGYHKPIMIAGGMGSIRPMLTAKEAISPGSSIVVLGGPAMLIGLGGGAASSQASGEGSEELDFASVQRDNPEMQRRCQEVINRCVALGKDNPILSIHDVGAGGLSNAVPEIIHDAERGGRFELRQVPNAEPSLSPLQIWCNEAQERYVLALKPAGLAQFEQFCRRERCPYAVIGQATETPDLILHDELLGNHPIDIPMSLLFGNPPRMERDVSHAEPALAPLDFGEVDLAEATRRVLRLPVVADKSFLIHIGDRSVGGLVARDQMVGPWQIPVADVAVTSSGFHGVTGEAMAMGERSPLALIDAPASGRMAVGEALTNLAAAAVGAIGNVKLSANWMAAAGVDGEDARLFDTVKAVGLDLCPALGIAIPVGKDSLSMKTVWKDGERQQSVTAPVSLIVSAFAPVLDAARTLTPQLRLDVGRTRLLLIDLGEGRNRLGGSALAQVYGQLGDACPDLDDPALFKSFFNAVQGLVVEDLLLAYHDRSDGGLWATVCEMAFASRCGVEIALDELGENDLAALFNEELGAVVQVADDRLGKVLERLEAAGLAGCTRLIGAPRADRQVVVTRNERTVLAAGRAELQKIWSETSYRMQVLRDNPECAKAEFHGIDDEQDPGLQAVLTFDVGEDVAAPFVARQRPRIAILREQGVNGHVEMAAAFDRAGFACVDLHMSDLQEGRTSLADFVGLAACGGFSYGDVLGAGGGWAKSILFGERLRDEFDAFFQRPETFGLGVCNGCQMMAHLRGMIPGAQHWPHFARNTSEQFEARVVMVEVEKSPSIFFAGMEGSRMPVVIAHGEGRAEFRGDPKTILHSGTVALRYVDHYGEPTETFPHNPNGSPFGITGLTTSDGRFTVMMPHPERCFRTLQNSWHPDTWGEYGPWMRMFRNARVWIG
ncbi:MAG: phosphoribosylformylglycinamidine synthase [Methylococcaceae bacterium]|nr:phosphoribosylformylglycinamidine synthase [Methylococcaceae bacterium]